ncbi:MAG: hypothetical protein WBH44_11320 [Proteocatella sp.]
MAQRPIQYINNQELTTHLIHKPCYKCEVDWSGPKMKFLEKFGKLLIDINFFVACLRYNQYDYVEPTFDMKMDTWLRCHINMCGFFEEVPACTGCDNLKTGVVKHTYKRFETYS